MLSRQRISVGIDVGTHQVRVVIAAQHNPKGSTKIIGIGVSESKGLRHGYIINSTDARRSIASAMGQAENAAGVRVRSAYASIGGVGLEEFRVKAETVIARADYEVTSLDTTKVAELAEQQLGKKILNRKVIHAIPISYTIDGEKVLGRPEGMKGNRLGIDILFITALEQHLQDLISTIEELGISVVDVMASPLAGSFVTLTKAQKMVGCVLANIGAETISIVVYENNTPLSVKVFPVGSTDITNDIALGLKISLEEAEKLKCGRLSGSALSQRKLDDLIQARLTAMFELIETHLAKIGKSGLLPAGVIISGGGSGLTTVEDLAKSVLKLPTRKALVQEFEGARVKDSSWAVAYGLCIWGFSNAEESPFRAALRGVGEQIASLATRLLP